MADVFDTLTLTIAPGASLPGPAQLPYADPDGPGTLPWDGSLGVRVEGRVPDAVDRTKEFLGVGRYNRSVGTADEQTNQILAQHADDLARRFGTRVYWVIGQDPKVKSCLLSLINGAMADTLTLSPAVAAKPGDDAPHPDVALAAQILAEDQAALDRLDPTIDSIVERLIRNMLHEAHAAAEILMEPAGPLAYTLATRGIIDKPLQSWAFIVDKYNHISGYAGRDPDGGKLYLPPSKLAVMAWETRSGDPRGTYLLRPTWVYWDFKERQLDPWFQFLDQFAAPRSDLELPAGNMSRPRLASDPAPPPGSKDTRVYPFEDAQIMMSRARALGYTIRPNGSRLTYSNPAGDGSAYATSIGFCDSQIVSSLLIDERSTQAVDYGARAAAEVGQDNLGLIIRKLKQLRCDFVTFILRVLNEANHGPDIAARLTPIVTVQAAEAQDQAYAVQAWGGTGWEMTEQQKAEVDGQVGLTPRVVGKDRSLGDLERQTGVVTGFVDAGVPLPVALRLAGVHEDDIAAVADGMDSRTAAESTMIGDGAPAGFDDTETLSPFEPDVPQGLLAGFAAKAIKGLTGGRWVTLRRSKRRLYIKGKGARAKVLAGDGASPDNPKSFKQVAEHLAAKGGKAAASPAAAVTPAKSAAAKPDSASPSKPPGPAGKDLAGASTKEIKEYHDSMSSDWSKSLNARESGAIQGYSSSLYNQTNGLLRHGKVEGGYAKKDIESLTKNVDAALGKSSLKESVTVYRGVKDVRAIGLDPDNLVGATIRDKAYLSTSLTPKIAERFVAGSKQGAVIRIAAPKGSKGASVSGMTNRKDEREVMFARNSGLKVTGTSRDAKGRLVIDAELFHG